MKMRPKSGKDPLLYRRLWMLIVGNVPCRASVGVFRYAGFGTGPYNSGVLGLWNITGLFDSVILSFLLLAVDLLFFDRRRIGRDIPEHVSCGLCHSVCDLFSSDSSAKASLCNSCDSAPGCAYSCLLLLLDYYTADLGVSLYDCIPTSIAGHTKWHFRTIRIIADCIWVIAGIAGSQMPGIATVLIAFCLGPFVEMFHPLCKALLEHSDFHRREVSGKKVPSDRCALPV